MPLSATAIAGIAGAGASMGGGILNTGANMWSARISRENANRQAEIQRQFEERMSSTSVSRLVEDMKKAGLNPYLLYGNGMSQASSPSGGFSGNSAVGQGSLPVSNTLSGLFDKEESDNRNNKAKLDRIIKRAELDAINDESITHLLDATNSAISHSRKLENSALYYYSKKDWNTGDKYANASLRMGDIADDLLFQASNKYKGGK